MSGWGLAAIALAVIAYAAFSERLRNTPLTAPLFLVAAGLLVGNETLGLVGLAASSETVLQLAQATLVLVLFAA
jgi:hypothetical protein